jgi:hypothetical protein
MIRRKTSNQHAVQKIIQKYRVNIKRGIIYNSSNEEIGSLTDGEPRVSVRICTPDGQKKYNTRISKVIAFAKYGPEALKKGVQVRHKNGNKADNSGANLVLVHTA